MRLPSGVTDQYAYFVAVDATDLKTRETGLATFTVYRSRNGAAAAAMTTPTINETDATNMPGVYELLLDEDTTIDAGDAEQEMVFHITHAGMAPVTRTITIFRPPVSAGETLTVTSGLASANTTQLAGQTVTAGAGVTFPTSVASPTNITAGTITTAANVTSLSSGAITSTTFDASGLAAIRAIFLIVNDTLSSPTVTANTVTIPSVWEANNNALVGGTLVHYNASREIIQARRIIATDIVAQTITVDENWLVNPSDTDIVEVYANGAFDNGRFLNAVKGNVIGVVGAASSTTSIVTSSLFPAASVADQFKGRIVTFSDDTTTAALRGQATDITASTSGGVLTVTALTTAPSSGDKFTIT